MGWTWPIDRRLRGLELFTILDHDAGFRELRLQRLRVRLGHGRRGRTTNEETVGDAARDHGSTEQEGQPALHEADATVSHGTCLAPRRLVPERRHHGEA